MFLLYGYRFRSDAWCKHNVTGLQRRNASDCKTFLQHCWILCQNRSFIWPVSSHSLLNLASIVSSGTNSRIISTPLLSWRLLLVMWKLQLWTTEWSRCFVNLVQVSFVADKCSRSCHYIVVFCHVCAVSFETWLQNLLVVYMSLCTLHVGNCLSLLHFPFSNHIFVFSHICLHI